MKERIILAPKANANELIKSLALHGVDCFNLRVYGSGEFARMALMRSGIAIPEAFLSLREETGLVAEAVTGEAYFGSVSDSDVREITLAIRILRSLVTDGDEEQVLEQTLKSGVFPEKNAALLSVYRKYMKELSERNAMDAVSLVRRAVMQSKTVDADFFALEEYPLSPLEELLLERVSGGACHTLKVQDLFHADEQTLNITSMKNCYGAPNEVEMILADIYAGKTLDQCTVVVTDPEMYGQLFFDYVVLYDIPVTFGCGIPVANSNPARLMTLYYRWITSGFFGRDSLMELLSSSAFDRAKLFAQFPEQEEFHWKAFYDVLGGIRFTNREDINRERLANLRACDPCMEIMARELALPPEEFIAKYSYIRRGSSTNADQLVMMLDVSALKMIYEELKVIRSSGVEQSVDDIISGILKTNVCVQSSEAGKLHVTGVDGAFTSVRENLYIAGLSASKYPGSPRENYLLLDADLRLFGKRAEYLTADERIVRKKEQMLRLVKLASALGSDIFVSYAGLNVSELKRDNASSLIFELYKEEHGRNATSGELEQQIMKVDYFEPAISVSRMVGDAYNQGKKIRHRESEERSADAQLIASALDREYSLTAIDTFFGCPRKFMLKYILGIPEQESTDPFVIISAKDAGILAHSLMETLGNSDISSEAFLKLAEEYFDQFISEHPPVISKSVEAEKSQFLEMMETAYEMDTHREVVLQEEDVHCVHESGVKIYGFPDRVEKLEDGSCLIVDYKSGRNVSHVQDDIGTCLQLVLYAYLMEQKGYKVSGGEYRYIRRGETVSCRYDEDMKQQLTDRLRVFVDHISRADFPVAEQSEDGADACKYCTYSAFCGKGQVSQ